MFTTVFDLFACSNGQTLQKTKNSPKCVERETET